MMRMAWVWIFMLFFISCLMMSWTWERRLHSLELYVILFFVPSLYFKRTARGPKKHLSHSAFLNIQDYQIEINNWPYNLCITWVVTFKCKRDTWIITPEHRIYEKCPGKPGRLVPVMLNFTFLILVWDSKNSPLNLGIWATVMY